jgi:hypothetical protein
VLLQIELGVTNFDPTPMESRVLIGKKYQAASEKTLLLRYFNDNIDETPEMYNILRSVSQRSRGAFVHEVSLPGTHVTPCLGPPEMTVRPGMSVSDVIGTAAALWSAREIAGTCNVVTEWLDRF